MGADPAAVCRSCDCACADGGTEGFQGHVRTIYPGITSCFECTLDLFPPQQAVPLCTIAETPRNAAHCILYAHLIEYPRQFPEDKPDKDDPTYQNWVYTHAAERAKKYNIPGVTLMHTQGVIKNIIPAIASTNAIVAAACANEAFKIVTNCAPFLDNNLMYMGAQGLYAPTFQYERNMQCVVCGEGVVLTAAPTLTLTLLMEQVCAWYALYGMCMVCAWYVHGMHDPNPNPDGADRRGRQAA